MYEKCSPQIGPSSLSRNHGSRYTVSEEMQERELAIVESLEERVERLERMSAEMDQAMSDLAQVVHDTVVAEQGMEHQLVVLEDSIASGNMATQGAAVAALKAAVSTLKAALPAPAAPPTSGAPAIDPTSGAPVSSGAAVSPTGVVPAPVEVVTSGPRTLYTHESANPFDTTVWVEVNKTSDGRPVYTFSGDTAPGDTKGASADWVVYTGTTAPPKA